MNAVECQNLTKTFGKHKAIQDLSIELNSNKIIGLIGRNGAGKTTLLKMIAGHYKADHGDIQIFSETPFNNLKISANTMFIEDNFNLPQSLNLEDIISSVSSFYSNWDNQLALELMEYFQLPKNKSYTKLSRGMKSTFNSILGLASRCPLTILDEPTLGMDASVRNDFYRALLKDFMKHPRTIILSSHLLNELENILDEVLLIDEGQKRLHLSMDELREYAVGLQGERHYIENFTAGKEILYQKDMGRDNIHKIVRNDFSSEDLQKARLDGISVSQIPPDKICIYLTAREGEGIDDVLDRA